MSDFSQFGLSESTLRALAVKGITTPTPIQAEAIPLLLSGERDVLGQARTGTGKTAAFGIPIIECISSGTSLPQALVLTPTRELCMQVAGEIRSLSCDRKLAVTAVYGGQAIDIQLRALKKGTDIVVGTPGRVIDLIERGALKLGEVLFAVLDEADEMLDMGFVEDIEKILAQVPEKRRMLMFSATMPPGIMAISGKFMRKCQIIQVDAEPDAPGQIEQYGYEVRRDDKTEALMRLLDMSPEMFGLVFCRTRADVDELCEKLNAKRYRVEALHGEISQAQRTKVIDRFKKHAFSILVATDVAARGIDVTGLTHVINYSLPQSAETYIHRIGRTGRAGKTGTAITFVTPGEKRKLGLLERDLDIKLEMRQLPTPQELARTQRDELAKNLQEASPDREYAAFAEQLLQDRDAVEVVAGLLQIGFGKRLLAGGYSGIGKPAKKADDAFVRMFVGAGKADGLMPSVLLDMIFEATRIPSRRLGRIDCFAKFSYIDVPESLAQKIMRGINQPGGLPLITYAREDEKSASKKRGRDENRVRAESDAGQKVDRSGRKAEKKAASKQALRRLMDEISNEPIGRKKRGR